MDETPGEAHGLARALEAEIPRLRAFVARLLGRPASSADAEDVQRSWRVAFEASSDRWRRAGPWLCMNARRTVIDHRERSGEVAYERGGELAERASAHDRHARRARARRATAHAARRSSATSSCVPSVASRWPRSRALALPEGTVSRICTERGASSRTSGGRMNTRESFWSASTRSDARGDPERIRRCARGSPRIPRTPESSQTGLRTRHDRARAHVQARPCAALARAGSSSRAWVAAALVIACSRFAMIADATRARSMRRRSQSRPRPAEPRVDFGRSRSRPNRLPERAARAPGPVFLERSGSRAPCGRVDGTRAGPRFTTSARKGRCVHDRRLPALLLVVDFESPVRAARSIARARHTDARDLRRRRPVSVDAPCAGRSVEADTEHAPDPAFRTYPHASRSGTEAGLRQRS